MRKAIIRLRQDADASFIDIRENFSRAWHSKTYQGEIFEFETPAALFSFLPLIRWQLLEYLQNNDAMALNKLVAHFGNIQQDVNILLDAGLIEKTANGNFYVPFSEIQADFTLRRAA